MKRQRTKLSEPGAKPTIATVAKSLGVSVMTVSRVLNEKPGVAAATRERVLNAIGELGYTVNSAARNLRRGSTDAISLVLPNIWSGYMSEVTRGVAMVLAEAGYNVVIYTTQMGGDRDQIYDFVLGQSDDGILMIAPGLSENRVRNLRHQRRPCVVIEPCPSDLGLPCVAVASRQGAALAVEHLLGLGHRQIGFIGGSPEVLFNVERLHGYQDGLLKGGLDWNPALVKRGDLTHESGAVAVREWLAAGQLPPAIFAANDDMALGAIEALTAAKQSVPEAVSVVGFDDVPMASQMHPGLTTVSHPIVEIGRRAAELLLAQINGQAPVQSYLELPTQLIVRGSTGSAPEKS